MKKTMYVTKEKMDGVFLKAKNKVCMLAGRKKAGVSTLVILLLLVVVSVALTSLFKTQITSLLNSIFKEVNSEVTSSLFTEPSVN